MTTRPAPFLVLALLAGCPEPESEADCAPADERPWHADADADGYGDAATETWACTPPSGMVADATDCDDTDRDVYPGAREVLDGRDNDCDGAVDVEEVTPDEADVRFYASSGSFEFIFLGSSVATGDLDGDGREDVLLGATGGTHNGHHVFGNPGMVYGFLGPGDGTRRTRDADVALVGLEEGDSVGSAVATGDVNRDGHLDVLVGASWLDDTGGAFLVLGPVSGNVSLAGAEAWLAGESASDAAGSAVAVGEAGADLWISAPGDDAGGQDAGAVYRVSGAVSGIVDLARADARLRGTEAGGRAGAALTLDDLDGDGVDDVLVGVVGWSGYSCLPPGRVYVVLGPVDGDRDLATADVVLQGVEDGDGAGDALATGDVDGDGARDVVVGGPGPSFNVDPTRTGHAWVVRGPLTDDVDLAAADATFDGPRPGDYTGTGVATGDVDGDGRDDVLVGASRDSAEPYAYGGAVYVLFAPLEGAIGLDRDVRRIVGDDGDSIGNALATSDVDGDGLADLLIGAGGAGHYTGYAMLFYGAGL